ncbi:ferric iron uptake transcriptional regulator [Providencia rettgeri]|nr:ferric iron uptake transcriptional regulator [Providencia rettgeri]
MYDLRYRTNPHDRQQQSIENAGLKVTLPRLKILKYFKSLSATTSVRKISIKADRYGRRDRLATVYRVLNQFDDAGIVTRHNFEGGKSVFELTQQHHHDHLICLDCGKVIEFTDESIETRQKYRCSPWH